MNELKRLLYKELFRKSFYDFAKYFWDCADPERFVDGKLIQFYCETFQYMCKDWIGYDYIEVDTNKIINKNVPYKIIDIREEGKRNININVPPRHSKSMIFNVLGPVWLWINYPAKAVSISHTEGLAKKMNEKRQMIINSDKFKFFFGEEISLIANSTSFLKDSRGGELYSLNRNAMTGYGGDIIINDDLTNAESAKKDKEEMNNAWSYYQNTMPSRINNINKCIIMNIQQRLAPNDITGHIMKNSKLSKKYIFVVLPAQFDIDTYIICPISGDVLIYKNGDYLWEERFGDYETIKVQVGESVFETQYLQKPVASDSTIIKEKMIIEKSIVDVPSIDNADIIYASHDFPVKDKETSDNLGSVVAYQIDANLYIIDALERKMAFVKSLSYVKGIDEAYPGIIQIIEDKANGSPILEQLQDEISGLQAFSPGTLSKVQRLESASVYIKNVIFVKNEYNKLTRQYEFSEQMENLIKQLLSFPFLEHDDVVDAFSMLLLFAFMNKKYRVYGRTFNSDNLLDEIDEELYSNIFLNREGDIWKICEIGVKYGSINKLVVIKELKIKGNIEQVLDKIKEFTTKNLIIDCSESSSLYGINSKGLYFEYYSIEDFDKSVSQLNLAFDRNNILINKKCSNMKFDIENFKYSKTKDENFKYETEKDGFCSCLRVAMKYYGIY